MIEDIKKVGRPRKHLSPKDGFQLVAIWKEDNKILDEKIEYINSVRINDGLPKMLKAEAFHDMIKKYKG